MARGDLGSFGALAGGVDRAGRRRRRFRRRAIRTCKYSSAFSDSAARMLRSACLAAELGFGKLVAGFGDVALALLAILLVAAELAAEMIELLFATGQFDLRGQAIAVALLAGGIELVDATGIVGHASFGLRQAGFAVGPAAGGRLRASVVTVCTCSAADLNSDLQRGLLLGELLAAVLAAATRSLCSARASCGLLLERGGFGHDLFLRGGLLFQGRDDAVSVVDLLARDWVICARKARSSLRREIKPVAAERWPATNVPSAARNSPASVTKFNPRPAASLNASAWLRFSTIQVAPSKRRIDGREFGGCFRQSDRPGRPRRVRRLDRCREAQARGSRAAKSRRGRRAVCRGRRDIRAVGGRAK